MSSGDVLDLNKEKTRSNNIYNYGPMQPYGIQHQQNPYMDQMFKNQTALSNVINDKVVQKVNDSLFKDQNLVGLENQIKVRENAVDNLDLPVETDETISKIRKDLPPIEVIEVRQDKAADDCKNDIVRIVRQFKESYFISMEHGDWDYAAKVTNEMTTGINALIEKYKKSPSIGMISATVSEMLSDIKIGANNFHQRTIEGPSGALINEICAMFSELNNGKINLDNKDKSVPDFILFRLIKELFELIFVAIKGKFGKNEKSEKLEEITKDMTTLKKIVFETAAKDLDKEGIRKFIRKLQTSLEALQLFANGFDKNSYYAIQSDPYISKMLKCLGKMLEAASDDFIDQTKKQKLIDHVDDRVKDAIGKLESRHKAEEDKYGVKKIASDISACRSRQGNLGEKKTRAEIALELYQKKIDAKKISVINEIKTLKALLYKIRSKKNATTNDNELNDMELRILTLLERCSNVLAGIRNNIGTLRNIINSSNGEMEDEQRGILLMLKEKAKYSFNGKNDIFPKIEILKRIVSDKVLSKILNDYDHEALRPFQSKDELDLDLDLLELDIKQAKNKDSTGNDNLDEPSIEITDSAATNIDKEISEIDSRIDKNNSLCKDLLSEMMKIESDEKKTDTVKLVGETLETFKKEKESLIKIKESLVEKKNSLINTQKKAVSAEGSSSKDEVIRVINAGLLKIVNDRGIEISMNKQSAIEYFSDFKRTYSKNKDIAKLQDFCRKLPSELKTESPPPKNSLKNTKQKKEAVFSDN